MSAKRKQQLRDVMQLAWQFIKKNGFTLSEALKTAWANIKLRAMLQQRIVMFYFRKVNGEIRQAFGTLQSERVPQVQGVKKTADTCQVFFDTEKNEWRCFKKCNLLGLTL